MLFVAVVTVLSGVCVWGPKKKQRPIVETYRAV